MKNFSPRFSILIPTTGRADIVVMAIESVLRQTYKDFEILVGDSSKEHIISEIVKNFQDERIEHMPVSDAQPFFTFDLPAKAARGEYLLWLDDDNYLMPSALELFDDAIKKTHAEIVTANHFYFYDQKHPRLTMRNSLGIVPYTGNNRFINLKDFIKDLYSFKRSNAGPRFHTSATIFSRAVAERAIQRVGAVLLTDMPNVHSHQPILFSFASSCFYIDHPVVLIGRLSISMSQSWSTSARTRFKKILFQPKFSPVIAYTRINGVAENYLRVKNLLPDLFHNVLFDYEAFFQIYIKELFYLDTDIITLIKNLKNLFSTLRKLPLKSKRELLAKAQRSLLFIPFIFLSRRLALNHIWRRVHAISVRSKQKKNPTSYAALIRGKREFEIPLKAYSKVNSIAALAIHLPEILEKETGIHIDEISI